MTSRWPEESVVTIYKILERTFLPPSIRLCWVSNNRRSALYWLFVSHCEKKFVVKGRFVFLKDPMLRLPFFTREALPPERVLGLDFSLSWKNLVHSLIDFHFLEKIWYIHCLIFTFLKKFGHFSFFLKRYFFHSI